MEFEEKELGISGFGLKLIAVVTMFIDHVGAALMWRVIARSGYPVVRQYFDQFYSLYEVLRIIGRMAFPIYCFLLVEGFEHTRSAWRYARNLLVFALLSEIPFDLAFNYTWLEFKSNNVFWTLLTGLLMMMGLNYVREKAVITTETRVLRYFLCFVKATAYMSITLAAMAAAEYLVCSDYGASGIAAIAALYFLREHRMWGFTLAVGLLGLLAGRIELYAILMLFPVRQYNGTRGYQRLKYVFYWFYPAHLLLIVAVCLGMGLKIVS